MRPPEGGRAPLVHSQSPFLDPGICSANPSYDLLALESFLVRKRETFASPKPVKDCSRVRVGGVAKPPAWLLRFARGLQYAAPAVKWAGSSSFPPNLRQRSARRNWSREARCELSCRVEVVAKRDRRARGEASFSSPVHLRAPRLGLESCCL